MFAYHFKISPEDTGFSAECIELKGCRTEADTREELSANMKEVLDLYLDEPAESDFVFPEPKSYRKLPENIIAVDPDPKIIMAQMVRQARLKSGLSQREMTKRLQFKSLSQYQRLEKRSNPTLETLMKLKNVLPDFHPEILFK